jgi:hypothetical protein
MRTDTAIYWQRVGVSDSGIPEFSPPVIIKCRWDNQQRNLEISETVEGVNVSGTVYPDRVLVVGSFLLYGNEAALNALSKDEKANPMLIQDAVMVKTQKITPKWRVRNIQWQPNDQSDQIFIEVTV